MPNEDAKALAGAPTVRQMSSPDRVHLIAGEVFRFAEAIP